MQGGVEIRREWVLGGRREGSAGSWVIGKEGPTANVLLSGWWIKAPVFPNGALRRKLSSMCRFFPGRIKNCSSNLFLPGSACCTCPH